MDEQVKAEIDLSVVGNAAQELGHATAEAEKLAEAQKKIQDQASNRPQVVQTQQNHWSYSQPQFVSALPSQGAFQSPVSSFGQNRPVSFQAFAPPVSVNSGIHVPQAVTPQAYQQNQSQGLPPLIQQQRQTFSSSLAESPFAMFGATALAVAAASKTARTFGDVSQSMQNQSLTGSERMRGVMENLGLGSFIHAIDAATGTLERMRAAAERYAMLSARQNELSQTNLQLIEMRNQTNQAASTAQSFSTVTLSPYRGGEFDRRTVEGNIRFAEYSQRQAAEDNIVRAERARNAASMTLERSREETGRQRRAYNLARYETQELLGGGERLQTSNGQVTRMSGRGRLGELDRLSNMFGENRASTVETLRAGMLANQDLLNRENALQQAKTNEMRNQIALAQAEKALGDARVSRLQAEVDILGQRAQRMGETQERLGFMRRGQREMGVAAVEMLQNGGAEAFENAPQELIDLARAVDPAGISQMARNAGAGIARQLSDRGIRGIRADFGDGRDQESVLREQVSVQAQIRVEMNINEANLAQKIAEASDARQREFVDRIMVRVLAVERNVAAQMRVRNISGGG